MKKSILIYFGTVFFLISCNNSSSNSYEKSPEELKMELILQEQNAPTDYLTADGTYRENFWGDKLKIKCNITNKATLATFKDAVVEVTYYSKTKTVIGTNSYTIYEIFPPNSKKTIELKIENFSDVASIGWDVINATVVN